MSGDQRAIQLSSDKVFELQRRTRTTSADRIACTSRIGELNHRFRRVSLWHAPQVKQRAASLYGSSFRRRIDISLELYVIGYNIG